MIDNLKALLLKYKSVILYLFFGVCTTLVNMIVYYFCAHPLGLPTMPSTILAWFAAVLFAYLTNRKWVFESEEDTASGIAKEMARFFGCRLATGIVDWFCMLFFVDILAWNDMIVKFGSNVLVVILNYIASKLIIFRKNKHASISSGELKRF